MNEMYFTEEHNLFRESLKDFLQKEVVPHIEEWEESGKIDKSIWPKFGEMGFFGLMTPEAYSGLNLDLFYTVIFLEELQKINSGGFAAAMWAHQYLQAVNEIAAVKSDPHCGASFNARSAQHASKSGEFCAESGSESQHPLPPMQVLRFFG